MSSATANPSPSKPSTPASAGVKDIFSYRKYWAARFGTAPFLPMSRAEMEALGWISSKRPKMIAVQADGCAPIVKAFEEGKPASIFWEGAATAASGLRVPKALGDFLVLKAVRDSGGTAIAVSDTEMIQACVDLASSEGIFAAPEGGSCVAALRKLLANGFLKADERMVIYNTGSGLKYLEVFAQVR